MTQKLELFPTGPGIIAGDHAPEPRHDRLRQLAAGFSLPNALGSLASESTIAIAPHSGYRRYFTPQETTRPDYAGSLSELYSSSGDFIDRLDTRTPNGNFPTVRYAAGWESIDHALSRREMGFDERVQKIQDGLSDLQLARDLVPRVYEQYPGYFLQWPGTMWRYQLAIDCAPTMFAIADVRDRRAREFDTELLDQSLENMRATIETLYRKYQWTMDQMSKPGANIARLQGRSGAIIGVDLEGVALYVGQLAAGNREALIAPSLKLDNTPGAAADFSVYTTRNWVHTAQVKRRVDSKDRKKYQRTTLVCATHHMRFPGEPLTNTIEAIINGDRQQELKAMGAVVLETARGSQKHGCSRFHRRSSGRSQRAA